MARQAGDLATRATARSRFVRISPYKVRQVAALIKGKPIDEARRILAFTPKAASRELAKVLESAVANAEHNFQIPQEELVVRIVSADEGFTIPRGRPRAQGRYYRIRKRTSHINLVVERSEALIPQTAQPSRTRRRAEPAPREVPAESAVETEEAPEKKPKRRPTRAPSAKASAKTKASPKKAKPSAKPAKAESKPTKGRKSREEGE